MLNKRKYIFNNAINFSSDRFHMLKVNARETATKSIEIKNVSHLLRTLFDEISAKCRPNSRSFAYDGGILKGHSVYM